MGLIPGTAGDALRGELVRFLQGMDLEARPDFADETSLLQSGLLDSMALFHLVDWIEKKTGAPIDPGSLDIAAEWDTIPGILAFVERRRHGAPPGEGVPGSD